MSFHFQELKIKNWLVYTDATIKFPDFKKGENIIVFNGRNGFGKTSLLKALQFLFYNEYGRDDYLNIWNERSRSDEGQFEISLKFEYNNHLFTIARGVNFKPWGNRSEPTSKEYLKIWKDGEEIEDQKDDQIMQIIPKECLQFVFFDGAEIQRYARKQYDSGVRDAIEMMLGIPSVRNLIYDLEKLEQELNAQQTKILSQKEENHEQIQKVDSYIVQIDNDKRKLDKAKEDKNITENSLRELQKEAATIQVTEAERNSLTEKKRRRAEIQDSIQHWTDEISDALIVAPKYILMPQLQEMLEDVESKHTIADRKADFRQLRKYLEDILDKGDCFCGRKIEDMEENHILQEVDRLEVLSNGDNQKSLLSKTQVGQLLALVSDMQQHPISGRDIFDKRGMYTQQLEEVNTDIYRLEQKLKDHDIVEIQELYRQIQSFNDKQVDLQAQIQILQDRIATNQKNLEEAQRELDQIASKMKEEQGITRKLQEVRKLKVATQEYVNGLVDRMRERIERITSEIFLSITNKPDEYAGVRVREDYILEVFRRNETVVLNTQLSAGEKEVLAYSFITALNLSTPTPTPFVMDTPFGHLDTGHRDSLLKYLPEMPVQVILLATDRDLPAQERDYLDRHICAEYEISRNQYEAISTIKEVK